MTITHTVSPEEDGLTLETLLRGPLALSGRQAREVKRGRLVTVDGAPMFSNQRVREGQVVRVGLGAYAPEKRAAAGGTSDFCAAKQPSELCMARADAHRSALPPVRVLYEDDALIAVYKPPMLQCHPSPSAPGGSDTLEARVCRQLGASAHPVHRLDAETSGIVLFAKLPYAQAHLQRQMQAGTFCKTYRAWAFGTPSPESGEIDAPIERLTPDSFTRVVRAGGQRAVSRYAVLERREGLPGGECASLVSLSPVTGRTHQLRVHMAHIGCPLLGDTRYASAQSAALSDALHIDRLMLAAVELRFIHPVTGESVRVACEDGFAL